MKYSPFAVAACLALVLAIGLGIRIFSQHRGFNSVVDESLASSEGYDQKFIDLVNHLEDVLTRRASFAYPGVKDPMTGRRREVANRAVEAVKPQLLATQNLAVDKISDQKIDNTKPSKPPMDQVKLTAIIADDYGQHTAIVMNGERSQSVDVGDRVGTRKVLKITAKEITMEDETATYTYDLAGNRTYQPK
jgi:hypothetical protein